MVDKAFIGAGKQVGLELWRIENLAPVKQEVWLLITIEISNFIKI